MANHLHWTSMRNTRLHAQPFSSGRPLAQQPRRAAQPAQYKRGSKPGTCGSSGGAGDASTRPEEEDAAAGQALASQFWSRVAQAGLAPMQASRLPRPSPLLSPSAVVAAQLDALQRNDWPAEDSGVQAAFAFTLPMLAELPQQLRGPERRVRSWKASEAWLSWPDFHAQLHTVYGLLLNCDSWRTASPLQFPSSRQSNKAVQAVEVVRWAPPDDARQPSLEEDAGALPEAPSQEEAPAAGPAPQAGAGPVPPKGGSSISGGSKGSGSKSSGSSGGGGAAARRGAAAAAGGTTRSYTFTFCLERVAEGPYKDCWLVWGVRPGNYALS